ncbi:MAG TPA: sulfatase-like hydrolase/transferase [Vicinamibacterales bacterium]|nr:sulfatase-like hydrolase/transferase [Vicinamibacterales bacterium]
MLFAAAVALSAACGGGPAPTPPATERPSILLVTLDTTRADAIGPDARGVTTPAFNALAARGQRFTQAYTAAPETLPAHTSIMTGLYPGGHGVHENARFLAATHETLAASLQRAGYRTTAFVSSFVLSKRFGLARGFDVYDDQLPAGSVERSAPETTDAAIASLSERSSQPRFVWVHYFDPHFPYAAPEPFRAQYAKAPYLGEVAAMDAELGRLVQAFDAHFAGAKAIIVAGDHGEGLGEHGEAQHGHLLYQSTVHVPLVVVAPDAAAGVVAAPVSTRRIFHTVLALAGLGPAGEALGRAGEVVLGEAMKPFLEYGWQPQVMAVDANHKSILAGRVETYDVIADPAETNDLTQSPGLPPRVPPALRDYPIPSVDPKGGDTLTASDRQKLASLGYVSGTAAPIVRKEAPRPAQMTRTLELIQEGGQLFVAGRYAQAIPIFEKVLGADAGNLDAMLRLATAYSALKQEAKAMAMFTRAAAAAPNSLDVRLYLALHYAHGPQWQQAVPMLEQVVAEAPERLPALDALADVRVRQNRFADALTLQKRIYALRPPTTPELVRMGKIAMEVQDTATALDAFERLRRAQGSGFAFNLELGVLYMAARRYAEARDALDRVAASHPEYPMALFKRAQVSVLLKEPDAAARIALASQKADATTRELIRREKLFQSVR